MCSLQTYPCSRGHDLYTEWTAKSQCNLTGGWRAMSLKPHSGAVGCFPHREQKACVCACVCVCLGQVGCC